MKVGRRSRRLPSQSRQPLIAFVLLAVILTSAYIYNRHPDALAYKGHTLTELDDLEIVWIKDLDLAGDEEIVGLGAGSSRLLVVTSASGKHLQASWYDLAGFATAQTSIGESAHWAPVGDTLAIAQSTGEEDRWAVRFLSSTTATDGENVDGDDNNSFVLEGKFADLQLIPLGNDFLAVLAYGSGGDPADDITDQLHVFSRENSGWQRLWAVSYPNEPLLHLSYSSEVLAVTLFQTAAVHPYVVEVRDLEGHKLWELSVEAPGWVVAYPRLSPSGRKAASGLWVYRQNELGLLFEDGVIWSQTMPGIVRGCQPLHPADGPMACTIEKSSGDRELTLLNWEGITVANVALTPEERLLTIPHHGLLLTNGQELSALNGFGQKQWTLRFPFSIALAAPTTNGLVVAGKRSLALAETQ